MDYAKNLQKHLSPEERDLLAVLKSKGYSLRATAKTLQRDPGTLSRELCRNAPPVRQGYYLLHKAHDRTLKRNQESHQRSRFKSANFDAVFPENFKMIGHPN